MPSKIRVGLLIDSFMLPAWVHETIRRINASDYATIEVVIKRQGNPFVFGGFSYLAYNLYGKVSRKYTKVRPKAFLKKNTAEILKDIPVIAVAPLQNKGTLTFPDKDVEAIKAYRPDVLVKFGFDKLGGAILDAAPAGVWTFDNERIFGAAGTNAGVWEVINKLCSTPITLKMYAGTTETILYQSFTSTGISVSKNQGLTCWKAVSFIPRRLKELYELGAESFLQSLTASNKDIQAAKQYTSPPANGRFIGYVLERYTKWIGRKIWNWKNRELWLMLYHFNDPAKFPALSLTDFKYKEIMPPSGKFWADPCAFKADDGRQFIFFEEYVYTKKRAHISVVEIKQDGTVSKPQTVLEKPYHLSYPFLLRYGSDIYMIPETSGNHTIEIYKCVSFPDKWEFVMNLMEEVHAVDTTIHFDGSKYWLFVNIKENKGASAWDELFLFYADELFTKAWKPHPRNPIVSDVRQARPAGHLIAHEGKLYRPSQDCSCSYGYATNINEIVTLNEQEYEEKIQEKLLPKWNSEATAVHTLSYRDGLAVLDARYKHKRH